jgi:uncharacterized protein YjbJ (UPF0337 family)
LFTDQRDVDLVASQKRRHRLRVKSDGLKGRAEQAANGALSGDEQLEREGHVDRLEPRARKMVAKDGKKLDEAVDTSKHEPGWMIDRPMTRPAKTP